MADYFEFTALAGLCIAFIGGMGYLLTCFVIAALTLGVA